MVEVVEVVDVVEVVEVVLVEPVSTPIEVPVPPPSPPVPTWPFDMMIIVAKSATAIKTRNVVFPRSNIQSPARESFQALYTRVPYFRTHLSKQITTN